MPVELLSLDAGGVLVFPNFERISNTVARHGIDVPPEALRAADPYGRFAVDAREDSFVEELFFAAFAFLFAAFAVKGQ